MANCAADVALCCLRQVTSRPWYEPEQFEQSASSYFDEMPAAHYSEASARDSSVPSPSLSEVGREYMLRRIVLQSWLSEVGPLPGGKLCRLSL